MKIETAVTSNPFPAEAVATFGSTQITCMDLQYMTEAHGELTRYLAAYARDDARYGGAIGIAGGHGSGKTHVLASLADVARNTRSIRSSIVYGKCDSNRVFDLYQQLMKQLDRSLVIELMQLALLRLAPAKVRSAQATSSIADRLMTAGSLQVLQAEQNIDLEELRQDLLHELETSVGVAEIARVLLDVPSAIHGVDAYQWICANDVADLASIGVTQPLKSFARDGTVDAETSAITALEAIAALHRLAGVPLLVLVDQLEVLLRVPDRTAFETLGSLVKKLVEQLGKQHALVYIAGIHEAWNKLPRDVPARFRRREPIAVGSLTLEETTLFVEAYTHARNIAPFRPAAIETIHELSGGSPREILRIAYQVYEQLNGDLSRASADLLLESARQSGSIGDRVQLALTIVDGVLKEHGTLSRELTLEQDVLIDRALLGESGEIIATVVVIKATDPLDEIDSARRVQRVRQYSQEQWPRAELIVITVGYSSAEVRELLAGVAAPLVFNEKTFESEFRTRVVTLVRTTRKTPSAPIPAIAQPVPLLAKSLTEISNRLKQLEERRADEAARSVSDL